MEEQSYVLTMLVANKPGVTSRVTGLFSGRGYNIEQLDVAPTPDNPNVSRMNMTVLGDDRVLEQATKQLEKLVDVIEVTDRTEERLNGSGKA